MLFRSAWLSSTLKDEPRPGNGKGGVSNDKLAKMLRTLKTNFAEGNSDQQLLQSMKLLLNDTEKEEPIHRSV